MWSKRKGTAWAICGHHLIGGVKENDLRAGRFREESNVGTIPVSGPTGIKKRRSFDFLLWRRRLAQKSHTSVDQQCSEGLIRETKR